MPWRARLNGAGEFFQGDPGVVVGFVGSGVEASGDEDVGLGPVGLESAGGDRGNEAAAVKDAGGWKFEVGGWRRRGRGRRSTRRGVEWAQEDGVTVVEAEAGSVFGGDENVVAAS